MTETTTLAPPPSLQSRRGIERGIDEALAAWHGIASEQLAGAALLALVAIAPRLYGMVNLTIESGRSLSTVWPMALQMGVTALINAFSLLLAIVLADRAVDRGAGRLRAYATAVVVGVLVGTIIGWVLNTYFIDVLFPLAGTIVADKFRINPRAVVTVGISIWLEWMTLGALATYVYADRREVRRIAARLKAAQDSRLAQVRQQLESELLATQARVEPQFLFDTLSDLQRLYETDPVEAERMLDSLIAFLRAAMPQARNITSTLEQEIALALAYVSIQSIRFSKPVSCTADLPENLRSARMPPMTLVPLLEQAMASQPDAMGSAGTVRIAAEMQDGRLRIAIQTADCRLLRGTPTSMTALRDRLLALYESDFEIAVSPANDRSVRATLGIPHELADV